MSSYYTASGQQGLEGVDPLTGLPKKKKQAAVNPSLAAQSEALNKQFGLGVYAPVASGVPGLPQVGLPTSTPDYRALIDNDALYSQAKLDFGAQGVSDAAQRAALTQRALTLFGQVPADDGLKGLNADWLNQDVTPETRLLAQQNTDSGLSVVARQAKAFKDQVRNIKNALAARGALRSGETGHQLQDAQLGYDQAKFDTTAELADFLSGLQRGYAESQRTGRSQLAAQAEAAAGRVGQQYPAPSGAPTPEYPTISSPAPGTIHGSPLPKPPTTEQIIALLGGSQPPPFTPDPRYGPVVTDRYRL